eukprot:TRINITY_DN2042_c0_g1_i1.p1 TRINITY_DN2042_c0_g1~~TRINITY_DN2042_c0_g1_i1.p1  ORF type:complete len:632 (-),score=107.01 TRINITY_DN2042_c0_g1_i1:253-2148(-)
MFGVALFVILVAITAAQEVVKDPAILHCDDVRPVLQIGSSTVFPVAQQHAQDYPNPMVAPQVLQTGSTLGFENFLAGGSDIATASRALKPSDYSNNDCDETGVVNNQAITECQGRLPVGVRVGIDELAVVVSQDADFWPDNISFDTVKVLFAPDLAGATFLKEIPEIAANATLAAKAPADVPQIYIPDAKSGTRDFFEEATGLDFAGVTGYVDDETLIEALLDNPDLVGVGAVPLAFASRNSDRIKILNIDGIDPRDTTQVEEYPMARPLYKYYDAAPGADNFAVLDYICALLGEEGQALVADRGYVALSPAEVAADRELLLCDDRFGSEKRIGLAGVMEDAATCRTQKRFVLIGSSTVYPISVEVARLIGTGLVIDARSTGSTIGILDLIAGAVEIAGASRSIRGRDYGAFDCDPELIGGEDESNRIASAPCQGVEPKGVIIGYDMLAVIISPDSPITSLTSEDLTAIFVDKADWDVIPGSNLTGTPTLFVPDANSGTHGFFEEVVGEINDQGYVNDNDIADGVAADPNAIGFLGVAYARGANNIKTVTIDGISPLDFNQAGSYYLARPLFYYYNEGPSAENPQDVKDLLCWVLGETGQNIVAEVGYVSLADSFPDVLTAEKDGLGCQRI